MKRALISLSAGVGLLLGFCSQPREVRAAEPAPRLDQKIKDDFMAGFQGDKSAMARACAAADKVLASQPGNAEAMVWLGTATLSLSGQAFTQDSDFQKGMELWKKGNEMMDKAVALQPDDIAVRVRRGDTLMRAAQSVPADWAPELLQRAIADFTHILELHGSHFGEGSEHGRGEVLAALADGYDRSGEKDKSREYLQRIVREIPGSEYAKRATAWLNDQAYPVGQRTCIGCHETTAPSAH
jgi:hypothetical protein